MVSNRLTKRKEPFLAVVVLAVLLSFGASVIAADNTTSDKQAESCPLCRIKQDCRKHVPWLDWGADLRMRAEYDEARGLDRKANGHDRFRQRYRGRIWTEVTPVDNLEFNARLVTEPRYYCRPDRDHQAERQEVLFDILNVKVSKAFGLPVNTVVGRQDIKLGQGWLVREGTPRDGSRTYFFDAARATIGLESIKTKADLVFIDDYANSAHYIRPFNDRDVDLAEQDERGAILYLSNTALAKTRLDGYFIYKRDYGRALPRGVEGEIYTFGGMAKGDLDEHWKYYAEIASQFGHKNGHRLCTLGANTYLRYDFNDAQKNRLQLAYEYNSGDDERDGYFDKLWGRYRQWSKVYTGLVDAIDGPSYASTNLHRISATWRNKPIKKLELLGGYHLLFAAKNLANPPRGVSRDGTFRGQLLSGSAKYTFNEHVAMRLLAEVFLPGDYYTDDRNDPAVFARYEITFSW